MGEGADDQIRCLVLLGGLPSGLEKRYERYDHVT